MQHFLRHIGITQSYVFFNTFVYPIFGQYNGVDLLWLAQNSESWAALRRRAFTPGSSHAAARVHPARMM
jgi:hypothetical protein